MNAVDNMRTWLFRASEPNKFQLPRFLCFGNSCPNTLAPLQMEAKGTSWWIFIERRKKFPRGSFESFWKEPNEYDTTQRTSDFTRFFFAYCLLLSAPTAKALLNPHKAVRQKLRYLLGHHQATELPFEKNKRLGVHLGRKGMTPQGTSMTNAVDGRSVSFLARTLGRKSDKH